MPEIKQILYNLCLAYVQQRLNEVNIAIESNQQAANEETKSSAGDKYETGRAMMQQESDRNMAQLNEANKLMAALNRISPAAKSAKVENGSLVITDGANFYIAISAGNFVIDGNNYYAISAASPIGRLLVGKSAGDVIDLNGKRYRIERVI